MTGIVLTTDLSEESQRAFEPVKTLAEKSDQFVDLVAVFEDLPLEPGTGTPMPVYTDPEEHARAWDERLRELAEAFGPRCRATRILRAADVADAVVGYAQEVGADCIAMATHGRSGLRRLLLGSVAEVVVRRSSVPVVLYPPSR